MGKVYLNDLRVYAHHGCLPEETLIGSDYRVDLWVAANLEASALSDRLEDTVDYVSLCGCVQKEMAQPSKLLEHVAKRILQRVFASSALIEEAGVTVSKINPPIDGHVSSVSVTLKETRI